jgi:uncharacterized protein (DUF2147 family)
MKKIGMVAMFMLFAFTVVPSDSLAQDKRAKVKHDIVQLSGMVKVIKDKDGKMTEVNLTTENGTIYKVTMNEAGKALEQKDKAVELSGYISDMDGSKWFTIEAGPKGKGKGEGQKNPDKAKKKKNKAQ